MSSNHVEGKFSFHAKLQQLKQQKIVIMVHSSKAGISCNTYTEGSAPFCRRYLTHLKLLFLVDWLIAKWRGVQPVMLWKFMSILYLSIITLRHSNWPFCAAICIGARPWIENTQVNLCSEAGSSDQNRYISTLRTLKIPSLPLQNCRVIR